MARAEIYTNLTKGYVSLPSDILAKLIRKKGKEHIMTLS